MAIADCSSRTNTGSQYIYHLSLQVILLLPCVSSLSILNLSFPSLHTWNQGLLGHFLRQRVSGLFWYQSVQAARGMLSEADM